MRRIRRNSRARTEVARFELQGQLIETALTKRGKPGRPGKLTADFVLDAAQRTESPMTAADVCETLKADGVDVTVNAVRNHLNALVTTGDLEKDDRKYVFSDPERSRACRVHNRSRHWRDRRLPGGTYS